MREINYIPNNSRRIRRSLITFDKGFPPRDRSKKIGSRISHQSDCISPSPLVKSISSSAGLTVQVLIVWLRQLMARPSEATKGGNKNAMEGFIGYHWPLECLDAFAHQNVSHCSFRLNTHGENRLTGTGSMETRKWLIEKRSLYRSFSDSGGRLNAFQSGNSFQKFSRRNSNKLGS